MRNEMSQQLIILKHLLCYFSQRHTTNAMTLDQSDSVTKKVQNIFLNTLDTVCIKWSRFWCARNLSWPSKHIYTICVKHKYIQMWKIFRKRLFPSNSINQLNQRRNDIVTNENVEHCWKMENQLQMSNNKYTRNLNCAYAYINVYIM